MAAIQDDFVDYPDYVPDFDNQFSPNCMYVNVEDLSPYICSLSLSICMLNIRSCKKNFSDFMANFYNYVNTFSCIIFTETWLTEDRDKVFFIPGFYCCNLYCTACHCTKLILCKYVVFPQVTVMQTNYVIAV